YELRTIDFERRAMAAVGRQAMKARRDGADPAICRLPAQLGEREIGADIFGTCVLAIDRDVRDAQAMIGSRVARVDREEFGPGIVGSARPLIALAGLERRRRRDDREPRFRERLRQWTKGHSGIMRPSVGRPIPQRFIVSADALQVRDRRVIRGSKAEFATVLVHASHRAAVTLISTILAGDCSRASMQARAGALPEGTQASQTLFISSTVRMSCSQIVACRSFDLSVPAFSRSPSMAARISCVCAPTLWPAVLSAVRPAR